MDDSVFKATLGALLHDCGKPIFRSGLDGRSHSMSGYEWLKDEIADDDILDCMRFHHKKNLANAKNLRNDAPVWVVYYADNVAAGADRRANDEGENYFDRSTALASIYNVLPTNDGINRFEPQHTLAFSDGIPFLSEEKPTYDQSVYTKIVTDMKTTFTGFDWTNPHSLNSLLSVLEGYWSNVPSSTNLDEVCDISLYDHNKICAAIAAATVQYLNAQNVTNWKQTLFAEQQSFIKKSAYLITKIDLSGIQKFIYTTSAKDALKNLRARSLYLEILCEHITDEILTATGLSRANCLYSGGGQAYLILSNTEETIQTLKKTEVDLRHWLLERFQLKLAIYFAWTPASADAFFQNSKEKYDAIFNTIADTISQKKLNRLTAEELQALNNKTSDMSERECRVCHAVSELIEENGQTICPFCANLRQFGRRAMDNDYFFIVTNSKEADYLLPVPTFDGDTAWLGAEHKTTVLKKLKANQSIRRVYSKNEPHIGNTLATNLWMGDAAFRNNDDSMASFEELADCATGIRRIAVLRADVDNLGSAFINGFRKNYTTLSRTAALSRSLSVFFKYHLNSLLRDPSQYDFASCIGESKDALSCRKATIVYAGGDDVFIVGAWHDVLNVGLDLYEAFERYTGGALHFSAGLGLFPPHHPLIRMANDTADLESIAKSLPTKNGIALFSEETCEDTVWTWSAFKNDVLPWLSFLSNNLSQSDTQSHMAFLYQVLTLLKQDRVERMTMASKDKPTLPIARLAYHLSRFESRNKITDSVWTEKFYDAALVEEKRRALISAIYLFIYLCRRRKGD